MDVKGSDDRSQTAQARLRSALAPAASAPELAGLLAEVGRDNPSRRRRLQGEVLHGALSHLAELCAACGWTGTAVIRDGQALVEQDGLRLLAEPEHFRAVGQGRGELILQPMKTFGVRPRVIVDLTPGSGDAALYLARRFPKGRVLAVNPTATLIRNFAGVNLAPENFEIAAVPLAEDGAWSEAELQALCRSRRVSTIDLLRLEAPAHARTLAAWIRTMAGRIGAACVTFAGDADDHLDLLAAFSDIGMVLCEKRSRPVEDPERSLRENLDERGTFTAWFVGRRTLERRNPPLARAAAAVRAFAHNPASARAWIYPLLERREHLRDSTSRRFEFEKLYAEKPDPWGYLNNAYEARKYRRTLEAALHLMPQARSVLEIACSIGVFTRVLARSYEQVVAVDIANEALLRTRRTVGARGNVRYVRGDLSSLKLGRTFDLIFCAEMLYYVADEAAPAALETLRASLAAEGLLFVVLPDVPGYGDNDPSARWKPRLLAGGFRLEWQEHIRDGRRAYFIEAYAHDKGSAA